MMLYQKELEVENSVAYNIYEELLYENEMHMNSFTLKETIFVSVRN